MNESVFLSDLDADDDDDYGGDDYDDGGDDLYIIGAVCLSQKSLFLYSKDLVVPHVSRHIPYSKNLVVSMFLDTFRIQGIWSFPCFLTLSVFKRSGRFHVS